jgi:type II secretory pathway component GspD/PulD (secretin)
VSLRALSRRRFRLALACALVVLVAASAMAEQRFHVYRPLSRAAAELQAPAQASLGSEGTATVDAASNALVLIGDPAAIQATLALLAELDGPRPTVVLHYQSKRQTDLEASGVRIDWSVDAGSVRIGNVHVPPGVDLLVIRPFDLREKRNATLAGMLRIQDGQSGRIETGSSVPVVEHVSPWESRVGSVSAASGFEARPRVQADGRVRVSLQPFEGQLSRRGVVHHSGASTEVVVVPGETVAIGGLTQPRAQRSAGTGGVGREQRYDDWLLLLRTEVEGGRPPAD